LTRTLREIVLRLDGGKRLRLLTNDLDSPARDIADLYKRRWAIELFFRWIKQNLKIRRFLGTSHNAVQTQIATALIAFILLRTAQNAQNIKHGALAFARLVRLNLMHRKPIDQLAKPPDKRPTQDYQLNLIIPQT
jgi:IS4 transposase